MIIVLTLGRSGSSLIMQSLQRLGVTVVGRQFGFKPGPALQAEHERLNPGGYFEEPEIYYDGPASEQFKAIVASGQSNIACKMDVRNFVSERHRAYWQSAADRISSVLVSYREPSEQAHSEFLGSMALSSGSDPRHQFLFITRFLRDYVETYGSIRTLMESELSGLSSRIHCIDRASALFPTAYIDRICETTGLSPPREHLQSAIANIDPGLFRVRLEDIGREERAWATLSGAATVYAELGGIVSARTSAFPWASMDVSR